ncbi:MAG: hypothetical protein HYY93_05835 [Planctomycetes bacterium]|nr:hypothetical protein [Planctomycetota bacterium]
MRFARFLVFPLALLAGCSDLGIQFGRGSGGVANAKGPRPWPYKQGTREPLEATWINPAEVYRRNYVVWQAEHQTFAEAVSRNTLGREASFLRLTNALRAMGEQLVSVEEAEILDKQLKRYERLNRDASRGNANRAVIRSIDDVRQTVVHHFAPAAIEVQAPKLSEGRDPETLSANDRVGAVSNPITGEPGSATPPATVVGPDAASSGPAAPPDPPDTGREPPVPPGPAVDAEAWKEAVLKWESTHDAFASSIGNPTDAERAYAALEAALAGLKTAMPSDRAPGLQIYINEYRRLKERLAKGEESYELKRQLALTRREMLSVVAAPQPGGQNAEDKK